MAIPHWLCKPPPPLQPPPPSEDEHPCLGALDMTFPREKSKILEKGFNFKIESGSLALWA